MTPSTILAPVPTAEVEALQVRAVAVPTVTAEQLDLVKKTIAPDATPDELRLYLYDCARQGVHPLDRLIHFTKRKGKYTPITSIDFMRIRAHEGAECLGISDPLFTGTPKGADFAASVTVTRLVQGQAALFTATARWAEYKPEANDFMWQKMPHTMLGKCAEALALRKGFPKQLAGLYAKEEMDQAEVGQPRQSAPQGNLTSAVPILAAVAPNGFENWVMDLETVAKEGGAALKKAWADSPAVFKKHLVSTEPETWDAIKAAAETAKPEGPPA